MWEIRDNFLSKWVGACNVNKFLPIRSPFEVESIFKSFHFM
jgi:hypothetical protein